MTDSRQVRVYRTPRTPDLYLYVDEAEDLARVPASLLERFGTLELALEFELTRGRKLARAQAPQVLEDIDRQGFHLQLPPPKNLAGESR